MVLTITTSNSTILSVEWKDNNQITIYIIKWIFKCVIINTVIVIIFLIIICVQVFNFTVVVNAYLFHEVTQFYICIVI